MNERYQLQLTLQGVEPTVTRTLEIPVYYSIYELHLAVQVCFWWNDLADFELVAGALTVGTEDAYAGSGLTHGGQRFRHADEVTVGDTFAAIGAEATYTYDFAKPWTIDVRLDGRAYGDSELPTCPGGTRAAPPEDVDGAETYEALLIAHGEPQHPANALAEEVLGEYFQPDLFNPRSVDEALAELFGESDEEDDDEDDAQGWSGWDASAYDDKARIEDAKYEVEQRLPNPAELRKLSAAERAGVLAKLIRG